MTDVVTSDRVSRRFVLVRAMSYGNTWSLTSVTAAGGGPAAIAVRVRLLVGGAARVVGGAGRSILGYGRGREDDQAGGLRTAMRGLGMMGGAVGLRYRAYRRPKAASASR